MSFAMLSPPGITAPSSPRELQFADPRLLQSLLRGIALNDELRQVTAGHCIAAFFGGRKQNGILKAIHDRSLTVKRVGRTFVFNSNINLIS